jgi:hypothetical protein
MKNRINNLILNKMLDEERNPILPLYEDDKLTRIIYIEKLIEIFYSLEKEEIKNNIE